MGKLLLEWRAFWMGLALRSLRDKEAEYIAKLNLLQKFKTETLTNHYLEMMIDLEGKLGVVQCRLRDLMKDVE